MIGSLRGMVIAAGEDRALIETSGVGHVVHAGARTLSRLAPGAPAFVWIETQLREDSLKLYGFLTDAERAWFVRLQEISGVGAKVALAILDVLTPQGLMEAAALEDRASFGRASGVGPKLAQRIAAELKGRAAPPSMRPARSVAARADGAGALPDEAAGGVPDDGAPSEPLAPDTSAMRDGEAAAAVSALVNLGIAGPEALRAVALAGRALAGSDGAGPDTAALIRAALKELGR